LQYYNFYKTVDGGVIQSSTSTATLGALIFELSDLPEVTSFTNLFDQYQFVKVDLKFIPMTQLAIPGTTLTINPAIYTSVDYDDSATPSTINTVLNYQNVRVHQAGRPFTISFCPHSAQAGYSGTFVSFDNVARQWHDCGSTGVIHFGLKYAMPAYSNISAWQLLKTYTIRFKGCR
jgi:hypothetical protein